MAAWARRILLTVTPSGKNRGKTTEDMKSRLISGNPPNQLDIDDAQTFDGRHVGLPAQREHDAERIRGRQAEDRQKKRQRQAAPFGALHRRQAENTAPHEHAHADQAGKPDIDQALLPVAAILAVNQQTHQHDNGDGRSPLFAVSIKTKRDEADIGRYDRPAGAVDRLALFAGRGPQAVDKGPTDKRRNDFPEDIQSHQRQQGIVPGAEEIVPQPAYEADMGPRWFDRLDR